MGRYLAIAALLVSVGACSKKKQDGLEPAQDWSTKGAGMAEPQPQPTTPHGAMGANPHGDMGANPHGDMGDGQLPAGHPDISGGAGGAAAQVPPLPPPDPNRKIDPTHHVKGVLKIHPKAKDKVKAGTAVFVVVKKAGPDGAPSGMPLAVDRLEWGSGDSLPFEISEANAMIAGTELSGDVVVLAHYDQDSDALSKQPGDILGEAKVTVPADNVTLYLDQVL